MRPAFAFVQMTMALLVCGTADAWDRNGHRLACVKAWTEMSEMSRAGVSGLLDVSSQDQFADSCSWADDVIAERPETLAWHHVLVSKSDRAVGTAPDCARGCIVEAIERQTAAVAGRGPKSERSEALRFLIHLVADLHQPLNVAFAEDHQGKDIAATFLGRPSTLYDVWNSHLLLAPDPPSYGYTPFLQQLTDRYNRERWAGGTARDWANETLWIMRAAPTGYVGNPGGLALERIFVDQNYLVAADQIGKAGVRIAYILNGIFR